MKLLRILLIAILFFSCNYIYEKIYIKCDYCNLSYNSDEILVTKDYEFSYHQRCYDIYFVRNKTKKPNIVIRASSLEDLKDSLKIYSDAEKIITKDTDIKPYYDYVRRQ